MAALAAQCHCEVETVIAERILDGGGNQEYCAGTGPPVLPLLTGESRRGGTLLSAASSFGLCSCGDLTNSVIHKVDRFNSAKGPYVPLGGYADVGVNGKVEGVKGIQAASLSVSSALGIRMNGDLQLSADLRSGGPTLIQGALRARDVLVNGDLEARDLQVLGTLTQPEGAALRVSGSSSISAQTRGPVSVQTPCPCGEGEIPDTRAKILLDRNNNDNGKIGLAEEALANFQQDRSLALPCGRYFLTRITGEAPLTLNIQGRVSLSVLDGLTVGRGLALELAEGAELDLLVDGPIRIAGDLALGASRPSRLRLFIAGPGAAEISAKGRVSAMIFAPQRDLVLSSQHEFYGGLFTRRVLATDTLMVHLDESAQTLR